MTDKDTMRFAFQKLSPCSRDVVVIQPIEDITLDQYEHIARQVQDILAEIQCTVLIMSPYTSIAHLPEETMNQHGWYKIENIPKEFKH